MKKLSFLVAALCATTVAATAATFVKTDLTSIKSTDVVLIVGTTSDGSYAMSNDKGTSAAPTAVSVTVSGTSIETEATNILWNITYDATKSTFTANVAGEDGKLYCNNSNNGVRVGTNDANVFNITSDYIYNTTQKRYLGVYNNSDWRCYKKGSTTNIEDQTFAFYVKEVGPAVDATAVAFDESALELEQYKYVTLTATPTPANATDAWTWASDNTDVATVTQNGKVTIVAATGTANITVTSQTTPTVTATCAITAKEATVLTCAQAVEKAEAVSADNEIAAGGMYVIRGYVTEIAAAYDDTYNNVSVWLADATDGGQVFEAYRVVPVDADAKAVSVGDFVEVVGDITKYNSTYETSAGGSLKIITKATPTALVAPELSGIYANGGTIEGIGAAGRIFTVSGMEVTSQNGALTSGIYIVKLGDKTQKIAVK